MKLSVIIPIFNNPDFFEQCLNCIVNQDLFDCEFLFIDDGSDDDCFSKLKLLVELSNDTRLKIYRQNKNRGYGATVNKGLYLSKGEYIAIFEPDDFIPKDFYSELIKKADEINVDIIKYNGMIKKEENKESRLFHYDSYILNKTVCMKSYIRFGYSHPSITNGIYKRDFLISNDIKFCSGAGASYQDQQFRCRLWYFNPTVYIIDKIKYKYVFHDKQSIFNHNTKVNEIIKNWNEEINFIKKRGFPLDFLYLSYYRQVIGMQDKLEKNLYKKIRGDFIKNFKFKSINLYSLMLLKKNVKELVYLCAFLARLK